MTSAKFVKQMLGSQRPNTKNTTGYTSKNELAEETVARVLLTGILQNQFYRSADRAAKEALPLFIDRAQKDPEFLLKGACFARSSHMKGMVLTALAALAGSANPSFLGKQETRQAVVALLSTFGPNQLIQFVELMKSKTFGRGFGSRPQKWVRAAMESWKPWKVEQNTLKYPTAMNQLVRLVHPRYKDVRAGLITYVLDGRKKDATGNKQRVVEELKNVWGRKQDDSIVANAMLDHEIPWDVVKGFAGLKGKIATAAMTQMGLSALLLNLRSLDQHGVFDNAGGLTALKMKMNEVKNGRSIPIDFAKPYIHSRNQRVKDILLDAMAETLDVSMGPLEGLRVGLSVDISWSMNGEPLQTAGLLSVPFLKAKSLWFSTFDDKFYEEGVTHRSHNTLFHGHSGSCPKIRGLAPRTQVQHLLGLQAAGATNIALPLQHATRQNRKLDLMVIITDEQQNLGSRLMDAWKTYKKHVNPKAKLWIINSSNYEWHSADFGDRSVTVYQSMTPAIFKNLQFVGQNLTQGIRQFDLTEFSKKVK